MRLGLLALPSLLACTTPTRVARAPAADEAAFTVMTYNVNYGLAGDPDGIEAIRAEAADIVVLQETNPVWERAIVAALDAEYRSMRFFHAGAAGGSAILSKFPLERVAMLHPDVDGSWFAAMIALVKTPKGTVQIANVHLRPQLSDSGSVISGYFETPAVRRAEMTAILAGLEDDLPTIVAGDFNESGGGALGVMIDEAYEDGVKAFVPDADTWRWNTSVGRIESQLDHIVYDARVEPLDVRVIEAGRSDHVPVVARLVLTDS